LAGGGTLFPRRSGASWVAWSCGTGASLGLSSITDGAARAACKRAVQYDRPPAIPSPVCEPCEPCVPFAGDRTSLGGFGTPCSPGGELTSVPSYSDRTFAFGSCDPGVVEGGVHEGVPPAGSRMGLDDPWDPFVEGGPGGLGLALDLPQFFNRTSDFPVDRPPAIPSPVCETCEPGVPCAGDRTCLGGSGWGTPCSPGGVVASEPSHCDRTAAFGSSAGSRGLDVPWDPFDEVGPGGLGHGLSSPQFFNRISEWCEFCGLAFRLAGSGTTSHPAGVVCECGCA
jgi:hypothetical protein